MVQRPCHASYAETGIGKTSTLYDIITTPPGVVVAGEAAVPKGRGDCNNGDGHAIYCVFTDAVFSADIDHNGKGIGHVPDVR